MKKLASIQFIVIAVLVLISAGSICRAQIPILGELTSQREVVKDSVGNIELIKIDNVNKEIELTDNLILKRSYTQSELEKQKGIIQEIESFNAYIEKQGREFRSFEIGKLSHFFLINARTTWSEYYKTLRDQQIDIQKLIREIQVEQNYYTLNKERWIKSIPSLEKTLSEPIKAHINSNIQKINRIIESYDLKTKEMISAENKVVQDIFYADAILQDIALYNNKRKLELFKQNEKNIFATIYKNSYSGSVNERIKLAIHENTKTFNYFFSTVRKNIFWYLLFITSMIYLLYFIRKKYVLINHDDTESAGYKSIHRIIVEKPILTSVIMVMFLWTIIMPYSPLFLSLFLFLASLILLLLVLAPVMNFFIKRIMVIVIILLTINNFEIFAWYFGNYSRFFILLEAITGVYLTFEYILPRYRIKEIKTHSRRRVIYTRIITFLLFVLYSIALISNITGFVNLSVYCIKLGVYTAVFSLLVINLSRINDNIIDAGVEVLNLYFPELVRKYGTSFNEKSKSILRFFLGLLWFTGILRFAEFYNSVTTKIGNFLTDSFSIGRLTFSIGNLLLFIFIIYATYNIAKFVKVILEREILARRNLKRGLAASVSLSIRIIIVIFGTVLALSFSGLDLGKIGIIAGALSVGIGFGLQNVVNNFISGLILIYEKPVQEGDTVQVDTLMGRVSNIGIRSSTLSTYDGAEVVVPNSNLISNQLINWTLSDNKKRVEVKVGTAYGSNPHQVIELLLKAALSHEKVITDPAPVSLFVGFGANSLDFRLLFWVRFEDGLKTQSDVAIKIYDLLKENKIEIPFPQLDLHIKNAKGEFSNEEDTKPSTI
jgi:potassium-dependent mechanosensitive channel